MISENKKIYRVILAILIAVLLGSLPVSAITIAVYGNTAGFDTDLHRDEFFVAYTLNGSSGTALDQNIDRFTDPSVEVIFMGGDDSFSADTASKIETAVAAGKILVVTNKPYRKFDASLPAENAGPAPGGQFMNVRDPNAVLSRNIFAGLHTQFSNTNPLSERDNTVPKAGTTTLLEFDTGDPALLYGTFGKGYVIEWTVPSTSPYLNKTEADFVNARLIRSLRATPITTPVPTATTAITPALTQVPEVVSDSGSMLVYSSPTGASILIDGVYKGTTPGNLTSIPKGNHILRLTMSGYFDYEGTIYVVPGETAHAFGTLPPLNQVSAAPTAIIIPVVVTPEPISTKAPAGPLDNPGVVVAIIGVITASIAAVTTIFTQFNKVKKELKEGKE